MFKLQSSKRCATWLSLAVLAALPVPPARAAVLLGGSDAVPAQSGLPPAAVLSPPPSSVTGSLDRAVQRGLWSRACWMATDALAQQQTDISALRIFAICSAVASNTAATDAALLVLRQTEGDAGQDVALVQGIVLLRAGSASASLAVFDELLRQHGDDPIAVYFRGCALRAEHRRDEAMQAFRRVLHLWPDNVQALRALADLLADPAAGKRDLQTAIELVEHATRVEPMDTEHWVALAALYQRSGQEDRAAAVKLQWLRAPAAPAQASALRDAAGVPGTQPTPDSQK